MRPGASRRSASAAAVVNKHAAGAVRVGRVVVVSAAYHGDVMPFVGPANLLAERGHDVTYVVPTGFHDQLRGERFTLAPYPLDFSTAAMHADPEHQRLMRHPVANVTRLARYWMRRAFVSDPDAVRSGLLAAFTGADVVVSHPTMCALSVPVARSLGVPIVVGQLFPMMVPTTTWSFPVGRISPDLGRPANQAIWNRYAATAGRFLYDRHVNALRDSLGLEPKRGNLLTSWMDADRTVLLVSRHYHPQDAPDWPPVTWGGFSHWTGPTDHPLDPAIDTFLDAGDPPVLVTLGTSAATGAGQQFAAIAAGLDDLGLRSLLLVGNTTNLAAIADRQGAFAFAPLTHVLPRCRLAVTSGALGTTAAALAAGLPVVVVPQLLDQVWHGDRVETLGVGLRSRRTSRDVVRAVARIDADPGYRTRAKALAVALAPENGAAALADTVESLLSPSGPTPDRRGHVRQSER